MNAVGSIGSERALEGAPVAYVWPAPDLQADFSELVDQSAVMYYGPGAFALAMIRDPRVKAVAAPAAVIRMLAPRRGVVPTSVAPLLAGRCFFATSRKP